MKSTGIVRKVDDLGRIVIPVETRRQLGINVKDPLEIHIEGEQIILSKYANSCVFCGTEAEAPRYRDKVVCQDCINGLTTQS